MTRLRTGGGTFSRPFFGRSPGASSRHHGHQLNPLRRALCRGFISQRPVWTIRRVDRQASGLARGGRCRGRAGAAAPTDQRTMISRVKALVPVVQNAGAALLLDGHVELVARAGADGAHLRHRGDGGALPSLKPDRIVGVGGLNTRHDAMVAGEAGADYVLFGEPDATAQRPRPRPSSSACNGGPKCSSRLASAMRHRAKKLTFAAAGADFILVGDIIWADRAAPAAALAEVEQAIRQAHAATFGKAKAEQG